MFDFDFKGIDIGDDRVKNWLVSLTISTLFGLLVTLPIQVNIKYLLSKANLLKKSNIFISNR
jgi:hypothetical protein